MDVRNPVLGQGETLDAAMQHKLRALEPSAAAMLSDTEQLSTTSGTLLGKLLQGEPIASSGPAQARQWRDRVGELLGKAVRDSETYDALLEVHGYLTENAVADGPGLSRRDVVAVLRRHPGTRRGEVADRLGADEQEVYWMLKELRQAAEPGETPVVVGRGRPLVYKLAGDPVADAADGWKGIGTSGRQTDGDGLRQRVLKLVEAQPGCTIAELQGHEDLGDFSDNQVYWALREMRDAGQIDASGRPLRHRVPKDGLLVPAAKVPGGRDVAPAEQIDGALVDERSAAATAWINGLGGTLDALKRDAEQWLRRKLPGALDVVLTGRVKEQQSFARKASRACGDVGKTCRTCRGGSPVAGPHFYYRGDGHALWSQFEDLVGLRVVVASTQDKERVVDLLASLAAEGTDDPREPEDLGKESKIPGYRATHLVTKVPSSALSDEADSLATMRVEVQVRTALQDAGARIQHALLYKEHHSSVDDLAPDAQRLLLTIFGQMEVAERTFDDLMALRARTSTGSPS